MMNHPSEEDVILIYLNDDGSDGLVAKHVAACEACNAASEEMSKLTKTLKSPVVWSLAGQEIDVPADLEELAETLAIEERESTTIFSNLRENAGDLVPLFPRTAGGIRYALQLCHDLLLQAPVDALRIADAAATVALELSLKHYPEEVVWYLRAEAEKERANALSLMGELSEALIAAQNSGRYIGKLSVGDFEHAVLGYVRAAILIEKERPAEAIEHLRVARLTFSFFQSERRLLHCAIAQSNANTLAGDYAAATRCYRDILASLNEVLDHDDYLYVVMNLAWTLIQLDDLDEASFLISDVAAGLSSTDHWRIPYFQWTEGQLLIKAHQSERALPLLEAAREGFVGGSMEHQAAIVSLDIAVALADEGRLDEARAELRESMAALQRIGLELQEARAAELSSSLATSEEIAKIAARFQKLIIPFAPIPKNVTGSIH